ncbi:CoA pyrophosphatase [Chitinivorax sp. B]|uniref:CoA pyrophosphatase n=1 Tax=Chitinivorax sp. B TaxID=2502235 RepID=UPI002017CDFB|nr:CoA pyrophosphatase [Chitinivorax sp. B]
MTFNDMQRWLTQRLSGPQPDQLNGDRLESIITPLTPASILAPIVFDPTNPTILLTQRTRHLNKHAGQISFPGGRAEPSDISPEATALRETQEEIGLPPSSVVIVGSLPQYITITGFFITPIVGLVHPGFTLRVDQNEVEEAFEIPLNLVLNQHNYQRHSYNVEGCEGSYLAISYGERFIWGATAAMLMSLCKCIKLENADEQYWQHGN